MKQYLKFSLLTIALFVSSAAFAMKQEDVRLIGDSDNFALEGKSEIGAGEERGETPVNPEDEKKEEVAGKTGIVECVKACLNSVTTTATAHPVKATVAVFVGVAVIALAVTKGKNIFRALVGKKKPRTQPL